jgi:MFS family permease
MAYW